MEINKLKNISLSALELDKEHKASEKGKTNYISKASVNLQITELVKQTFNDNNLDHLTQLIYEDLLDNCKNKKYKLDSIGVSLIYDGHLYENSIKLATLNDMKKYGTEDVVPIYEFCKMSIIEK